MAKVLLRWVGLALLAALACWPGPAEAARARKDRQMEQLVKQAQQQFEAGEYGQAAETLIKAYDLKPMPKLLYNIARAYDKAGDSEQALRFYQRYIDASDTDAELVRNAANRLAQIREEQARLEAEEQRRIDEDKRQAEAERQRLEAEKQRLIDEAKRRQQEAEQRRVEAEAREARNTVLAIAGYSLMGLGVLGVGTGGYFGIAALMDRDAWNESVDLETRQALRDSARGNALGADIAIGSGALLTAAGGGLVLISLLSSGDTEAAERPPGGEVPAVPSTAPSEQANPATADDAAVQDRASLLPAGSPAGGAA